MFSDKDQIYLEPFIPRLGTTLKKKNVVPLLDDQQAFRDLGEMTERQR